MLLPIISDRSKWEIMIRNQEQDKAEILLLSEMAQFTPK